MKICSKCKIEKDETEFYKRRTAKDGLMSACKKCTLKSNRRYNQTNRGKDSNRRAVEIYYQSNRGKLTIQEYQQSDKRKAYRKEYQASFRIRKPEVIKAYNEVNKAVKSGKLIKQPCHCGETKVGGHHEDYSRPLDVIWLCSKHHGELEKSNKKSQSCSKNRTKEHCIYFEMLALVCLHCVF